MEAKDIISSGLLELYATGIASEEEMLLIDQYAALYPEVAEELAAIRESMEKYAQAHSVEPDAGVKEKVFTAINTERVNPVKKVVRLSIPYKKYLAAASVVLLFGSIALNIFLLNKNHAVNSELQESLQISGTLQQQNDEMRNSMHVVQDKFSMPVSLHAMPGRDAEAKVFWMANSGEVYIDPSNLPEAPEGKHYQLWAIVDGQPVSGGMIATSGKGSKYHIQKMKSFGKAEAFAVTLEDTMDSPVPKGPMYVMGKM